MFNLISNNQVILGPMEWRKTFFENVLMDDLEISFTLPQTNNGLLYVNPTTFFAPVTFEPNPTYNPKTQFLHGPFWNIQLGSCTGSYIVQYYTVEAVQNMLVAQLADMRWKYETSGVTVTIQGVALPITTQRIARDIYAQALQLGSNGATWKFGNTWLVLSTAELTTIVQAIMNHVQSSFTMESTKYAAIMAANTIPLLDAITFDEFNVLGAPLPGVGIV